MSEQLEEIKRALDALTSYSETIFTSLHDEGLSEKEMMFYKKSDGEQPWLEIMQIRSELLLARAMATGPLAQAAETKPEQFYCEICQMVTDHLTNKHPWPSRVKAEFATDASDVVGFMQDAQMDTYSRWNCPSCGRHDAGYLKLDHKVCPGCGANMVGEVNSSRSHLPRYAHVPNKDANAERIRLAKVALLNTGFFKAEEVSDDIAPRITELWAYITQWQEDHLARPAATDDNSPPTTPDKEEDDVQP